MSATFATFPDFYTDASQIYTAGTPSTYPTASVHPDFYILVQNAGCNAVTGGMQSQLYQGKLAQSPGLSDPILWHRGSLATLWNGDVVPPLGAQGALITFPANNPVGAFGPVYTQGYYWDSVWPWGKTGVLPRRPWTLICPSNPVNVAASVADFAPYNVNILALYDNNFGAQTILPTGCMYSPILQGIPLASTSVVAYSTGLENQVVSRYPYQLSWLMGQVLPTSFRGGRLFSVVYSGSQNGGYVGGPPPDWFRQVPWSCVPGGLPYPQTPPSIPGTQLFNQANNNTTQSSEAWYLLTDKIANDAAIHIQAAQQFDKYSVLYLYTDLNLPPLSLGTPVIPSGVIQQQLSNFPYLYTMQVPANISDSDLWTLIYNEAIGFFRS